MHRLAAYLKEHEGFDCILDDFAFASYRIHGDECYIRDIWIEPEHRKKGISKVICDQIADIAQKAGCKYLTGSVNTNASNPTISVKLHFSCGFKVHSAIDGGIIFRKDL